MMNIEVGQGFSQTIATRHGHEAVYSLVVGVDDNSVSYVPVVRDGTNHIFYKSYDELGAVYDRDRNNVRLNDCPPPFFDIGKTFVSNDMPRRSNAVAIADMDNVIVTPIARFRALFHVLDDGAKISDRDKQRVFVHPWPVQKERELCFDRRLPDVSDISSDVDDLLHENDASDLFQH